MIGGEMYVGYSTVEAIVGDKIAPDFADWYLAKNGYDAQQTDEPVDADRQDNLWQPLPGDHGAHGTFGDRATGSSPQLWANRNRRWLVLGGGVLAGLMVVLFFKRDTKDDR
jgi:hypothetical protein